MSFNDKVSDNRMLIKNHDSNSDKMTDNDVQIQVILMKQFKSIIKLNSIKNYPLKIKVNKTIVKCKQLSKRLENKNVKSIKKAILIIDYCCIE